MCHVFKLVKAGCLSKLNAKSSRVFLGFERIKPAQKGRQLEKTGAEAEVLKPARQFGWFPHLNIHQHLIHVGFLRGESLLQFEKARQVSGQNVKSFHSSLTLGEGHFHSAINRYCLQN